MGEFSNEGSAFERISAFCQTGDFNNECFKTSTSSYQESERVFGCPTTDLNDDRFDNAVGYANGYSC